MAASKSQKIQAEIDKVKAKISEQQARLKELEKNKLEAENSEIVEIVRGMSISLADLPLVLQQLRGGASGHGGQKSSGFGGTPTSISAARKLQVSIHLPCLPLVRCPKTAQKTEVRVSLTHPPFPGLFAVPLLCISLRLALFRPSN